MSNTFLTPTKILREAILQYKNNLSGVSNCKRISKKDYEIGGMKAGTSINVAIPNEFTVRDGATFSGQDLTERSVAVAVDQQKGVDITGLTSLEMSMKLEDFSAQFIKPAMSRLAAEVEKGLLSHIATNTYNLVGTPATTPASALVYLQAGNKITNFSAPLDMRTVHINPAANAATVDGLKGLFNAQAQLGEQYAKGLMAKNTLGFDFYVNQAIPVITNGSHTMSSGPALTAQPANGATTLAVGGMGASKTIKAGEVFTIASVYSVNPLTKQSTGELAQFVVTADTSSESDGTASISVSPAVYFSGAFQNVSAQPGGTAALTFVGTASTGYAQNLAWYQDAVAFANVQVEKPMGVDFAASETFDGISMRVVRNYDISYDRFPIRFDVYYGHKLLRPEWACRITG